MASNYSIYPLLFQQKKSGGHRIIFHGQSAINFEWKSFVPQSAQIVYYSGLQPSSGIIQLFQKPAIIHEYYSLSIVSETEYHVEEQTQMETVLTYWSMKETGSKDSIISCSADQNLYVGE